MHDVTRVHVHLTMAPVLIAPVSPTVVMMMTTAREV